MSESREGNKDRIKRKNEKILNHHRSKIINNSIHRKSSSSSNMFFTFQRERDALPQEIFRESVEPEKGGKVITSELFNLDETCPDLSRYF